MNLLNKKSQEEFARGSRLYGHLFLKLVEAGFEDIATLASGRGVIASVGKYYDERALAGRFAISVKIKLGAESRIVNGPVNNLFGAEIKLFESLIGLATFSAILWKLAFQSRLEEAEGLGHAGRYRDKLHEFVSKEAHRHFLEIDILNFALTCSVHHLSLLTLASFMALPTQRVRTLESFLLNLYRRSASCN